MQTGRNAPCSCGSGRKFKHCCGRGSPPAVAKASAQTLLTTAVHWIQCGEFTKARSTAHTWLQQYPEERGNASFVMGFSFAQEKQWQAALPWVDQGIEYGTTLMQPPELFCLQAKVRQELGLINPALQSLQAALQLRPEWPEVRLQYAGQLLAQRHFAEAEQHYRCLLLTPEPEKEVWVGLGLALKQQGDLQGWLQCWNELCQRFPEDIAAAHTFARLALAYGFYALAEERFARAAAVRPEDWTSSSSLLYVQNYRSDRSLEEKKQLAIEWGDRCSQQVQARLGPACDRWEVPLTPVRLRVGLASGDLRRHPVGYFLEAMLPHLDYTQIELYAIDNSPEPDALTERIRPYFSNWQRVTGLEEAVIRQQMQSMRLHVLLDLAGHTRHTLMPLFACRPAPVQVAWLGYFASTGLPEMDAVLVDRWVEPETALSSFREKRWYLPETYRCFSAPEETVEVAPLPALERGYLTFGCFNHLSKLHEGVWRLWQKILEALPEARLIIKTGALDGSDELHSYYCYLERLQLPMSRIELRSASPRRDYLQAFADIDISLDPFPFTGGTVSIESLWMGVPVLTLQGHDFLSRSGANILGPLDLGSWVCPSEAAYLQKAVSMATALQELAELRRRLRPSLLLSPLMDAPRFAKHWQAALWSLWQQLGIPRCQGTASLGEADVR